MNYIFVSGHLDLTPEEFREHYVPQIEHHIDNLNQMVSFIVGDARGADTLFQTYKYNNHPDIPATVYHMFQSPRNNVGNYPTRGGFTSDKDRDTAMTKNSNVDVAWVRPGRERSGTAKNLIRRSNIQSMEKE